MKSKTREEFFAKSEVPFYFINMSASQIDKLTPVMERKLKMGDLCVMPVHYIEPRCEEDVFGEMVIGNFREEGLDENGNPDMFASVIYYIFLPKGYAPTSERFPNYRSNDLGKFILKPGLRNISKKINSSLVAEVQKEISGK